MQDVEQGNHEAFGTRAVGGNVSVNDRENQAEQVGKGDAQERVSRVDREGAWTAADLDMRSEGAEPVAADFQHSIKERETRGKHHEVGKIGGASGAEERTRCEDGSED